MRNEMGRASADCKAACNCDCPSSKRAQVLRCASCTSLASSVESEGESEPWEFEPGPAPEPPHKTKAAVWALALRKQDDMVFTASQSGEVCALAASSCPGEPDLFLGSHSDGVYALVVSPDGRRLYSASADGRIGEWDISAPPSPQPGSVSCAWLDGHTESVYALAISADGSHLYSAGEDCDIRVWRLHADGATSATCVDVLDDHDGPVTALAVGADGALYSAGEDCCVRVFRPQEPTGALACVAVLEGHKAPVTALQALPDGRTLLSGSWDETIRVWEVWQQPPASAAAASAPDPVSSLPHTTMHCCSAVLGGGTGAVLSLAYVASASGPGAVLSGGSDCTVRLWRLPRSSSGVVAPGNMPAPAAAMAQPLNVSREASCSLVGHRRAVTALISLPGGLSVMSASMDRTLRSWRVALPSSWSTSAHSSFPPGFRCGVSTLLLALGCADSALAPLERLDPATKAGLAAAISESLARMYSQE